jgi:hypothetical protein
LRRPLRLSDKLNLSVRSDAGAVVREGLMARIGLAMLFVALASAGMATNAQAFQGFRCASGRLVDEGDRPPEVSNRCGDPDFADSHEEQRTVRRTVWTYIAGIPVAKEETVTISVMVEEWTYDLGPNRFIRHLIFEQNRLVRVWTSERGTKN